MDKLIAPSLTGGCTVRLATDQRLFELHPLDVGNCEVGEGYEDTGLTPWDVHSILARHKAASAWVSCAERLPTAEDCGDFETVIILTREGKMIIRPYWGVNLFGQDDHTHWMPTGLVRPEPPAEEA